MSKRAVESDVEKSAKRAKDETDSRFADGLFEMKDQIKKQIAESSPYKHGVIAELVNDKLLRDVRNEIMENVVFTKKETDIYKVHQTGDLANLSGLDSEELSKLKSLDKLRNALYSQEFRNYLTYVTGSGPLSGIKKDLSINVYQKGCHLLNHDDVIGSRRISYILYMPDPDEPWDPKWGGALRLYSTVKPNIPETDWSLSIPPKWNQLAFFTVQPGHSFHDVEEVYVDKPRMSISGWFHIPQKGEEGFKEGEQEDVEALSSLKQLESRELRDMDFPKRVYEPKDSEEEFGSEDREYLKKFLNPKILEDDTIANLNEMFSNESMLEVHEFLNAEYASKVQEAIEKDDLATNVPQTSKDVPSPWQVARPPHKARYLYLDSTSEKNAPATGELAAHVELEEMRNLFSHPSFVRWLAKVSSMDPTGAWVLARRFRPGLDFTLATTHESEHPVLEATLGLTDSKGWESGEVGGYDLCMTVDDDELADPAEYRGGHDLAEEDEEDSPVLLNNPASWNVFSLILRDQGILRFVKYVSKNALGSRWDISAEWTVKEDEDEDEDDNTD